MRSSTAGAMSAGCGEVKYTHTFCTAASHRAPTSPSRAAKVGSAPGRSRPYEFTFWPSRVMLRYPRSSSSSTSRSTSAAGRDTSRPRV